MKKIKIVLISALMLMMLAACGESEVSQLQKDRQDNALLASRYVIDIIQMFVDTPNFLGDPYTDYTYDELGEYVTAILYQYNSLLNGAMPNFSVDGYVFANAVDNFQKGLAETGPIIETSEEKAVLQGNDIVINMKCTCEKGDADIEIIFTNNLVAPELKSAAFNVEYTLGQKMSKAALNTVIGMGTVFIMLILISFIISLFGVFSGGGKKKEKKTGVDLAVEQIEKNETAELSSNSELVAVIAAAIAAYEGSSDTSGFVVRSVRRIKRQ